MVSYVSLSLYASHTDYLLVLLLWAVQCARYGVQKYCNERAIDSVEACDSISHVSRPGSPNTGSWKRWCLPSLEPFEGGVLELYGSSIVLSKLKLTVCPNRSISAEKPSMRSIANTANLGSGVSANAWWREQHAFKEKFAMAWNSFNM
jgi:hypothetical protein